MSFEGEVLDNNLRKKERKKERNPRRWRFVEFCLVLRWIELRVTEREEEMWMWAYDECTEKCDKKAQKAKKFSHFADKKCKERETKASKSSQNK